MWQGVVAKVLINHLQTRTIRCYVDGCGRSNLQGLQELQVRLPGVPTPDFSRRIEMATIPLRQSLIDRHLQEWP